MVPGWLLLALTLVLAGGPGPAGATDRLEQFRRLAVAHLALQELTGTPLTAAPEIYALVDEEILESLQTGGPFASREFLQERLDAFSETWGGAAFRLLPARRAGGRSALVVGAFVLSRTGHANSVRVYGQPGGAAALLRTLIGDGVPEIHEWPPARDGAAQFAVSWLGIPSGRGSRALRVDLWRQRGENEVDRVWSSAEHFPDGLWAARFAVRSGTVFVRSELRYPGWKPGCDGQAEQEDDFRWVPAADTLRLARRQIFNGWHRELQASVARFFKALGEGDRRALAELVPDSAVRSRLPARLIPEPACEFQNPDTPGTVVVAATEERPGGRAPWSLWWSRAPRGWRVAGVAPVLQ
jgi:hypothetical protein